MAIAICPPARAVALAGIWDPENWVRTFAVITCPANDLTAQIHDRMPVIVPADGYDRWLANIDPDPNAPGRCRIRSAIGRNSTAARQPMHADVWCTLDQRGHHD